MDKKEVKAKYPGLLSKWVNRIVKISYLPGYMEVYKPDRIYYIQSDSQFIGPCAVQQNDFTIIGNVIAQADKNSIEIPYSLALREVRIKTMLIQSIQIFEIPKVEHPIIDSKGKDNTAFFHQTLDEVLDEHSKISVL